MKNDPDQTVNPIRRIKLCEKCNVQVRPTGWDAHINSKKHLTGEPDPTRKACEICNIEVRSNNYNHHFKNHKLKE